MLVFSKRSTERERGIVIPNLAIHSLSLEQCLCEVREGLGLHVELIVVWFVLRELRKLAGELLIQENAHWRSLMLK